MKEYRIVRLDIVYGESDLNRLAQQGFEIVAVTDDKVIMERDKVWEPSEDLRAP